MRATGAVLLGKTNLHELGVAPIGVNMHYGIIRNPHDPNYYAGGSSSGSAAAVAAGLCPFAIGHLCCPASAQMIIIIALSVCKLLPEPS